MTDIITRMPVRDLTSFLSTAEDVLACDLPKLGEILLLHLNSWKDQGKVWQPVSGLNRLYFVQVMEGTERGLGQPRRNAPEYGARQPAVTQKMQEAWNWLDKQGFLMHKPDEPSSDWFLITGEGEKLLSKLGREAHWEKLGVDRVKHDLLNGGFRVVGGPPENQEAAWEWVRMKENKPPLKRAVAGEWVLIAESRLDELRALTSPQFDLRKLIRLCEELNIASREECHLATAMLTRGLLDHIPPLFGYPTFKEVANNYTGGGKSFKDSMQHLEGGARKIADAHLHVPIRKSETLPAAQQVNFAPYLDVLLAEIVRITR
jgi:hypothetical protein